MTSKPRRYRLPLAGLSLLLATAVWLPSVRLLFPVADAVHDSTADSTAATTLTPRAQALAARHLALWEGGTQEAAVERMRRTNPEWDFMGRTFLVLSLANMALREPAQEARYLKAIDAIVADTLRLERERGAFHFVLDYGKDPRAYVDQPARSVFVDGEIALMLAARCQVEDRPDYHAGLKERLAIAKGRMQKHPVTLSAESYPDECWTFCNTVALAALTVGGQVLGEDHAVFTKAWVETAKASLVHAPSGLLVSKYTLDGKVGDGPEGSSIWMAIHCLWVVDPVFARAQYDLARASLGRTVCGFGYAKEWPPEWVNQADVDSGPIVPGLEASAGSSGLALLGAATAGDEAFLRALIRSLDLAAFPIREGDGLRYAASNQVGDAVLLYALTQGPLWAKVLAAKGRRP